VRRRPSTPETAEKIYRAELRQLARELGTIARLYVMRHYDPDRREDAPDRLTGIDWQRLRETLGSVTTERARELARSQARRVDRGNIRGLERVLRINLNTESRSVKLALARFERENVALIRSIATDILPDVRKVVRAAHRAGTRPKDLAALLVERTGVAQSRADLIARDQTLKANSALTQIRHKEAGVERYAWGTSRDERVRDMHAALEGRIFEWSDPPITNEQGDRNGPGEDYQCRCVAIPVFD